jgi:hypothetical protein
MSGKEFTKNPIMQVTNLSFGEPYLFLTQIDIDADQKTEASCRLVLGAEPVYSSFDVADRSPVSEGKQFRLSSVATVLKVPTNFASVYRDSSLPVKNWQARVVALKLNGLQLFLQQ